MKLRHFALAAATTAAVFTMAAPAGASSVPVARTGQPAPTTAPRPTTLRPAPVHTVNCTKGTSCPSDGSVGQELLNKAACIKDGGAWEEVGTGGNIECHESGSNL